MNHQLLSFEQKKAHVKLAVKSYYAKHTSKSNLIGKSPGRPVSKSESKWPLGAAQWLQKLRLSFHCVCSIKPKPPDLEAEMHH